MQITNMDSADAMATANDFAISSDLVATIPPPTDFGIPSSSVVVNINTTDVKGAVHYPSTSTNSSSRYHFSLSGESGIEWLESPSRQPPVTLVRGKSSLNEQGPGHQFDFKM